MQRVILLIEPDPMLAKTYAEALAVSGYGVSLAASAQAAISSADNQAPDLVILEIELARHNGFEFLHEFRSYAEWQDIPVIINSSVPPGKFRSSQREVKLLGIRDYLYKPKTSLTRLISAVASELANEPANN